MGYSLYFATVWGSVTVSALGVVGFGVASIVLGVEHSKRDNMELAIGLGSAAAFCLVYTLLMRTHGNQVLVRAGRWPALCQATRFPKTSDEAVAACKKLRERNDKKPPVVVGGAWGYYLYRKLADPNCIFTHRMRGLVDESNQMEWYAGTTIREVLNFYSKRKLTVSTHPTMEYITIGAWFATASHGNGGDLAEGSSHTMASAFIYNMRTGQALDVDYKGLRIRCDSEDTRAEWIVLKVTLQKLIPNETLQKKAIVIKDAKSADQWLKDDARLRLCFMGAARDYGFGIRWEACCYDQDSAAAHHDPHCCSRFCAFLQADVCSVVCGWREGLMAWRGQSSYLNANRWMPALPPVFATLVTLTGYLNAEIYFRLESALTGLKLWSMIKDLIQVHKEYGGRSEIRYGRKTANTTVFLDMSMKVSFHPILSMLHKKHGVTEAALHIGKYQCTLAPLKEVPVGVVYGLYAEDELKRANVGAFLFGNMV
jgi:hypothetical protein